MRVLLVASVLGLSLSACTNMQRSAGSGYASPEFANRDSRDLVRDRSVRQTAYELGKDPANLNASDIQEIQDRHTVRQMERTLRSNKEKEQYSKILPWLQSDAEKVEFLSIPSIEGRQAWINKNKIWNRSAAPKAEMRDLVETQDIAMGMPQEYVRKSWGDPTSIDVSGNPIYKNERWRYERQSSSTSGYRKETRFVYFEGGRVVGWETQ
ncbi:hypothetical protein B9G69_000255 [Bdellovibrio sp. SKB1291214]|uniref:hypothetical protein n=1 Tax=Bdellovibrio sp. SKB1291214 TaxID=1732569 RepID=UPI000B51D1EC|nr:hypothetical protein [Bdellovibrio sp. SKB1291214]UYL09005.1 hypothetical protein B9G69_000255 [Bdellovibrio sp. SKB1291214]